MITLLIPDCRIRTFRRWVSFLANVFELYELLLHWIVFQSPSNLLKKPWKMVHRVIGLIWRTGLSFLTEKPSYVKLPASHGRNNLSADSPCVDRNHKHKTFRYPTRAQIISGVEPWLRMKLDNTRSRNDKTDGTSEEPCPYVMARSHFLDSEYWPMIDDGFRPSSDIDRREMYRMIGTKEQNHGS
ncbi:hypothetical protein AO1008_03770 [Aspergillus oryzae 100-8]|uniref:Uncharacterized protein n=1 Tax=Aspergillus oryzae (strain 3.042) TaxID=1160506 RepID=I8TNA6_ASPO3|nr:hypothetical protein Ao3042_08308 [Aspergillus oryzae 3.042]KDE86126.1 hypothetical protein AO1008_03770 [Aspergillus oryzae 100-8]|eukprot:EIT75705.1 hypothetical protein Ao3042_08308 [Aspergillus oryzae 3.042]